MKKIIIIAVLMIAACFNSVKAQVEHVPVSNSVYDYLLRAETRGWLPHFSLSSLPLQRKEIKEALEMVNSHRNELSSMEKSALDNYLVEFEIMPLEEAVVFPSDTDSLQVLSGRMFSNSEKYIYHYDDGRHSVSLKPLASADFKYLKNGGGPSDVIFGNLGFRLYGTLSNKVGYFLQATNGSVLSGDRALAAQDDKLGKNVKFSDLNSDFDFTESHVHYEHGWFYAKIARETKLLGAGLNQRIFISTNAPPADEIGLGVKFRSFEYSFSHAQLLGLAISNTGTGFNALIPDKYMAMHRFAYQPSWGEIAFWESAIYSDRNIDLAYLNPLSFYKSVEHSLRDRDNSAMGIDATIRPFGGLQLKGSFFLDDIIISKIGTGYWSNKTAWNVAAIAALDFPVDLGLEYSRVEPYTYTHFNPQNTYSHDSLMYGSNILPNSDRLNFLLRFWPGGRYPVDLDISYTRHGENIYENGELIENVGGDPLQTRRPEDPFEVEFLDGRQVNTLSTGIRYGIEVFRNFSLQAGYTYVSGDRNDHMISLSFRFEEF